MATASHKRKVSFRRATTRRLASRAIKKTVKSRRRRNISEGFYDASGTFHPIRSASDYDPGVAGETGRKAKTTRSRKRLASKRKASATARRRSLVKTRKATTSRLAGRAIKKSSGLLKKRGRKNPSAESIRKEFAGRHDKDSKLYFPDGTPTGLAKLGKLIKIETKSGPIELSNRKGEVWLCADTHKRFHLGSTIKAPLYDGPPRNLGEVKMIEYQEAKPHLGYRKTIWFHEMGEEGGRRPTLHANNKGELKFKGGDYRITVRGIEN